MFHCIFSHLAGFDDLWPLEYQMQIENVFLEQLQIDDAMCMHSDVHEMEIMKIIAPRILKCWWEVKLGRNRQSRYIWINLSLQLNTSLFQQYFAWHFPKKFRVETGHIRVRSLLITIPSRNQTVRLCHTTKVLTRLSIKSLPFFSTSIPRALHYCLKVSVHQIQHIPALPLLLLHYQHSGMEKEDDFELIHQFFLCFYSVTAVLDLIFLNISS